MSETVFSKIIDGDIPSHKVYEDDYVYAFLDISQVTKGHTLLVPKKAPNAEPSLAPNSGDISVLASPDILDSVKSSRIHLSPQTRLFDSIDSLSIILSGHIFIFAPSLVFSPILQLSPIYTRLNR